MKLYINNTAYPCVGWPSFTDPVRFELPGDKPDAAALSSFVQKIFRETENAQVAFSPEFTICNDCGRVARGLRNDCEYCGSENVDGITRITGYFTRTSSWNRGKRAELRDRRRNRLA